MATVFTKKYRRPRTTTLSDFSVSQRLDMYNNAPLRSSPRVLSPTRRCNPHPTGLVFQKPYNKDHTTFDIWNPNFGLISQRMPTMITHLERANFSSGRVLPPVKKRGPPEIIYTTNSTSRQSYQWPKESPKAFSGLVKHGRFGQTPYNPALGIVPNTLTAATSCYGKKQ